MNKKSCLIRFNEAKKKAEYLCEILSKVRNDNVTGWLKFLSKKEGIPFQTLRRKYYLWKYGEKSWDSVIDGRVLRSLKASDEEAFAIFLGFIQKSKSIAQARRDLIDYYRKQNRDIPNGFSYACCLYKLRNPFKTKLTLAEHKESDRCKTCREKTLAIISMITSLSKYQKGCKNCKSKICS